MTALGMMLGIALVPVTATWAVLRALRLISARSAGGSRRPRRRASDRRSPDRRSQEQRTHDRSAVWGPPVGASLGELVDELGRLERGYRQLEQLLVPPSDPRLHALTVAYDATLRRCCAALGLPLPGPPPLEGLVRLEVEATLAQHGLSW